MCKDLMKIAEIMKIAEMLKEELVARELYSEDDLQIVTVNKLNDQTKIGVCVRSKRNEAAPIYYVCKCVSMDTMIEEFVDMMSKNQNISTLLSDIFNLDKIKDTIFPRIINKNSNSKYLENKPFKMFLDFAIVYALELYDSNNEPYSVVVTKTMLKTWNIDVEILDKIARNNFIEKKLPSIKVRTLPVVIADLGFPTVNDEFANEIWAVTTNNAPYGATAILFDDVLAQIEYITGFSHFYIIPSSIHEILIVKTDAARIDVEELKKIIKSINDAAVEPDEVLSNNLYIYIKGKGVDIV